MGCGELWLGTQVIQSYVVNSVSEWVKQITIESLTVSTPGQSSPSKLVKNLPKALVAHQL